MAVAVPVAVRGLCRSYGEFEALRGLELEIDSGECVALIGRNGSGKTTAVAMIQSTGLTSRRQTPRQIDEPA